LSKSASDQVKLRVSPDQCDDLAWQTWYERHFPADYELCNCTFTTMLHIHIM